METVREKLMHLLDIVPCGGEEGIGGCPDRRFGNCKRTEKLHHCVLVHMVDNLLNNGVTIATDTNVGDKWVHDEGGCWYCPKCGCSPAYWEAKDDNQYGLPPYCHSCGAKLEPPKGV